jgi:hypothetical protein
MRGPRPPGVDDHVRMRMRIIDVFADFALLCDHPELAVA